MSRPPDPTPSDVRQRLQAFRPAKGRLDVWLLEYSPLAVLAQLNLTGLALIIGEAYWRLAPSPLPVTWAVFSPVYGGVLVTLLVEAVILRRFLTRIPGTFAQLWEGRLLAGAGHDDQTSRNFSAFLDRFEHSLNSRHRLWLGGVFATLGLVFTWSTGHLPYTLSRWVDGSDWTARLIITLVNTLALFAPAVAVGYAIGVAAWKSIVTALFVRRFSKVFELAIQPSHPDKAGGLKPLGDLIFTMAAILIVASLALSGLTLLADYEAFALTRLYSRIFLVVTMALSLVVFIWPLLSAHDRMLAEKRKLDSVLLEITQRIAELERSLQTNLRAMEHTKRNDVLSEIESLANLYRRVAHTPTWPFDREIVLKFVTPQIVSLLSLIGAAEPIVDAIRSLVAAATSGQP